MQAVLGYAEHVDMPLCGNRGKGARQRRWMRMSAVALWGNALAFACVWGCIDGMLIADYGSFVNDPYGFEQSPSFAHGRNEIADSGASGGRPLQGLRFPANNAATH